MISEGKAAESIVNELIKGPIIEGEGYYPVFPKAQPCRRLNLLKEIVAGTALFCSSPKNREKFTIVMNSP